MTKVVLSWIAVLLLIVGCQTVQRQIIPFADNAEAELATVTALDR